MSALRGLNFSREYHGLKKLTVFNLNEKRIERLFVGQIGFLWLSPWPLVA